MPSRIDPEFATFPSDPASGWAPRSHLCSYRSEAALKSFVWSHRGFDSQNSAGVDASHENMHRLLDMGITNFDVDVVKREPVAGKGDDGCDTSMKDCFLVSHPSRYQSYVEAKAETILGKVPTLDSLLHQVESFYSSEKYSNLVKPIISIEPKFYKKEDLRKLVAITQANNFRKTHTALVSISQEIQVTLEELLKENSKPEPIFDLIKGTHPATHDLFEEYGYDSPTILEEPKRSMIGISVRTLPSSKGTDFLWDHKPQWWLPSREELPAGIQIAASRSSRSQISNIPFGSPNGDCCTIIPHYTTLNTQIVFVDHKILRKHLTEGKDIGGVGGEEEGTFSSVCQRHDTHFVTWVVDEEEEMWRQLEAGVDGIITNEPARMIKALVDRYRSTCKV